MKETKRKTNARNDCDMKNICLVSYQNGKKGREKNTSHWKEVRKSTEIWKRKKLDKWFDTMELNFVIGHVSNGFEQLKINKNEH